MLARGWVAAELAGIFLGLRHSITALAAPEADSTDPVTIALPPYKPDEENPAPDAVAQIRHAAAPLVARWLSPAFIDELAMPKPSCMIVLVTIDWVIRRLQEELHKTTQSAHQWQDQLITKALKGLVPGQFFTDSGFRALLHPALSSHRICLHSQEFIAALALMHGQRCLYPAIFDTLGNAVLQLAEISKQMHLLEFMISYKGVYSFWDDSTDVLRHVDPIWNVLTAAASYGNAMMEVRRELDKLRIQQEDNLRNNKVSLAGLEFEWEGGAIGWQDAGGAFSEMHYLHRQLTNGWHLDLGLMASLIRLWRPPIGFSTSDLEPATSSLVGNQKCHTSVVDFGAGAGRYCEFLNGTGEFCCSAYDGSPSAAKHSQGKVQTRRLDQEFDLGQSFDWVMCLEVAEHIPRENEATLLANLRRHAKVGLILSWSEDGEGPHQNARPWRDVQEMLAAVGFVLDVGASAQLMPQLPWMRGAVHVFTVS